MKLTLSQRFLMDYLQRRSRSRGYFVGTNFYLAKELQLGLRTIGHALRRLEDLGLIARNHGHNNERRILVNGSRKPLSIGSQPISSTPKWGVFPGERAKTGDPKNVSPINSLKRVSKKPPLPPFPGGNHEGRGAPMAPKRARTGNPDLRDPKFLDPLIAEFGELLVLETVEEIEFEMRSAPDRIGSPRGLLLSWLKHRSQVPEEAWKLGTTQLKRHLNAQEGLKKARSQIGREITFRDSRIEIRGICEGSEALHVKRHGFLQQLESALRKIGVPEWLINNILNWGRQRQRNWIRLMDLEREASNNTIFRIQEGVLEWGPSQEKTQLKPDDINFSEDVKCLMGYIAFTSQLSQMSA